MLSINIIGRICTITLKHKVNALSRAFIKSFNEHIKSLEENDAISVIIITGHGKIFSAGADLNEIVEYKKNKETDDFIEPWQRLSQVSKPVIIALNGITAGGGLEIALQGDIILGAQSLVISLPEVSVGVIPGGGATQRLTHLIGPFRSNLLCLTGEPITANEAMEWGIVQKIIPDNELMDEAFMIAQKIAKHPLDLLKKIKLCVNFAKNNTISDGLKFERTVFYSTFDTKNHDEALNAFFEKRKPVYI